jgi:hypothetical protein
MPQRQFDQHIQSSNKTTQGVYHNRQYPPILSSMFKETNSDFNDRIHLLTSVTEDYGMTPEPLAKRLMQAEA